MKKPPCSDWGIWEGSEIEGLTQIGVKTLFVRRLPTGLLLSVLVGKLQIKGMKYDRIWFCKEFVPPHITNYNSWLSGLELLFSYNPRLKVAIEVDSIEVAAIASRLRRDLEESIYYCQDNKVSLYYKIGAWVDLDAPGDHVCVGQAFNDRAFVVKDGVKVTPDLYLSDTCLDEEFN